jgi:hypothetical protein
LYAGIEKRRMKSTAEPFRFSYWWLNVYCLGIGVGIAVPLVLILTSADALMGKKVPGTILWPAIAGAVAGAELVGAFAVGLMWWFRPVYISRESLTAFRAGGGYRQALWSEISAVRPVNMLGLRYLRVYTFGSKYPIWVPLYLSDRERFYWRVCDFAGPQHPLAVALEGEHFVS